MDVTRLLTTLKDQGIHDARVLRAMAAVPREQFVPQELAAQAWEDQPLPIGFNQTISQPFVVAYMLQALALRGHEKVLEIGTGSGYQTALLARLCARVYSVEIVPELLERARAALAQLDVSNVALRLGDGTRGWPQEAPFDAIIGAAAAQRLPEALAMQVRPEGRLVLPLGPRDAQRIVTIRRDPSGEPLVEVSLPVRFVPLVAGGDLPA